MRPTYLLMALLVLHAVMLGWSATVHSPTPDEIAHIAAGLSHWQLGDFSLYRVNPPLARMVATLPIYVTEQGQEEWLRLYLLPGDVGRTEFTVGSKFVEQQQRRFFWWLVMARWSSGLFSLAGAAVCYLWAKELYGVKAGLLAAILWCCSPMVLGFGAIVTPDVPSAATGALALYTFWRWLVHESWSDAYIAGVGLGIAELTKSTWLILPPLFVAISLIGTLRQHRMFDVKRREQVPRAWRVGGAQLALIFAIAWTLLMSGYGFQGAFQPMGDYFFKSSLLTEQRDDSSMTHGNRFRGTLLGQIPVPLPREYLIGIDHQKAEANSARLAYMRGELREKGWWYYYLYALAIKSTLGGLLLFLAAMAYRFSQRRRWPRLDEWILLLPMVTVLVLISHHTGLNKHSRYLLPIFPLAIVWSSQCITASASRVGRAVVGVCAVLAAASSLACYPHSMSYFNELIGGPKNGRFHLLNSNIDWGQDLYFLEEEIKRRGWERVGMAHWTTFDLSLLDIDFFAPPVAPHTDGWRGSAESEILEPGHYAISVCHVHGYSRAVADGQGSWVPAGRNAYSYFREFEPVGTVGYSILLYELTADDIRRSKTWGPLIAAAEVEHGSYDRHADEAAPQLPTTKMSSN